MSDRWEEPGESDTSAGRMDRARAAIDRSFEELAGRVERAADESYEAPPGAPRALGAEARPMGRPQPMPGDGDIEGGWRVPDAAEGMDERVGRLIAARLRSAERRLELQAQALEAALGEEAVQARLAAEELEQARGSLRAATGAAIREAEARVRDQGASIQEDVSRDIARVNQEALEKFRDAVGEESRLQRDRLERGLIEEVEARLRRDAAAQLEAGEARVGGRAAAGLAEARRPLEALARTIATDQAEAALADAEARLREELASGLAVGVESSERRIDEQAGAAHVRQEASAEERSGRLERLFEERAGKLESTFEERVDAAVDRAVSARMESAAADLSSRVRTQVDAAVAEERAEATAGIRSEVQSLVRERVQHVGIELDARVNAATERSASIRTAFEEDVARLRDELEGVRAELSRRSIKRARERLEVAGAEQLAKAVAALDAAVGTARADVEQARAGAEAELEQTAVRRGEQVVADALESRTAILEQRLDEIAQRNAEMSERRLASAVEAAEARIASADRAQDREEAVRRRIDEARAAAEARVRAAERRLAETLAQLGAAVPSAVSPGPPAG